MKELAGDIWGIQEEYVMYSFDKDSIAIESREMGDLSKYSGTLKSFREKYNMKHPEECNSNVSADFLYYFSHSIKEGDYIIYKSIDDEIVHIGKITGDYTYKENKLENKSIFAHTYPVEWIKHIPYKYFPGVAKQKLNEGKSLYFITDYAKEFLQFLDPRKTLVKEKHSDWENARISQLLTYLEDCQQGIRDLNSQILTVLTVVSSLLSLLFGISIFRLDDKDVADQIIHFPSGLWYSFLNELVTRRRLYFWFTIIIFAATVSYIIFLAIEEILRYHYAQHLADRLHTLIPGTADDIDRNALLIFEQFKSPIRTLNFKHLTTSHSMFNYFVAYLSGALATVFCLGLTLTQYVLLPEREWYDHTLLVVVILVLLVAIGFLIRFYNCADGISEKAFGIGNNNLEVRKGIAGKNIGLYEGSKEFRHFFYYIILPRTGSILKIFLIIAGFCYALVYSSVVNRIQIKSEHPAIIRLTFIVIVLELLLYQAGYHFNDIRGIKDGKSEDGKRKRLVDYIAYKKPFRIGISIIMASLRFSAALLLIVFLGGGIRLELLIVLAVFIVLAALYEMSRSLKIDWLTLLLVGAGFPLRFLAGALSASSKTLYSWPWYDYVLLFSLLFSWGKLISLLLWVRDVNRLIIGNKISDEKTHVKEHYNKVYSIIKQRYTDDSRSILSYTGNKDDVWSICYWVILGSMAIYRWVHMGNVLLLVVPMLCLIISGIIFMVDADNRLIYCCCFVTAVAFDIYGAGLFQMGLFEAVFFNSLLVPITISICILKRKSIRIHKRRNKLLPTIAKFIIGEEAYEGLKTNNRKTKPEEEMETKPEEDTPLVPVTNGK